MTSVSWHRERNFMKFLYIYHSQLKKLILKNNCCVSPIHKWFGRKKTNWDYLMLRTTLLQWFVFTSSKACSSCWAKCSRVAGSVCRTWVLRSPFWLRWSFTVTDGLICCLRLLLASLVLNGIRAEWLFNNHAEHMNDDIMPYTKTEFQMNHRLQNEQ